MENESVKPEKRDFIGEVIAEDEALRNPVKRNAPVPPAGGEVEVLGYATRRNGKVGSWLHNSEASARSHDSTALNCKPAGSEIIATVDRIHVTRLEAESAKLREAKVLVEIAATSVVDAKIAVEKERDALKAEVERLRRAEKNDLIAYNAAIEKQNELRNESNALRAKIVRMKLLLSTAGGLVNGATDSWHDDTAKEIRE